MLFFKRKHGREVLKRVVINVFKFNDVFLIQLSIKTYGLRINILFIIFEFLYEVCPSTDKRFKLSCKLIPLAIRIVKVKNVKLSVQLTVYLYSETFCSFLVGI